MCQWIFTDDRNGCNYAKAEFIKRAICLQYYFLLKWRASKWNSGVFFVMDFGNLQFVLHTHTAASRIIILKGKSWKVNREHFAKQKKQKQKKTSIMITCCIFFHLVLQLTFIFNDFNFRRANSIYRHSNQSKLDTNHKVLKWNAALFFFTSFVSETE